MHTTTNLLVATNFFGLSSSNIPNYKIYNHIYQFNILFKAVLYDLMDNFIYFSNGQFHIFKLTSTRTSEKGKWYLPNLYNQTNNLFFFFSPSLCFRMSIENSL